MTKIIVLSDSHGYSTYMRNAIEKEIPDMIIHLGDGWNDIEELHKDYEDIPLEHVIGNCDWVIEVAEKLITVEGKKILMCHGDKYYVKSGYNNILYAGLEKGADIVLFGHTHNPLNTTSGNMIVFNPGSIRGNPMLEQKPSYGIIEIDGDSAEEDNVKAQIKYVD